MMSNRPRDFCKDCWDGWAATQVEGADVTLPPRKRPADNPGPRCTTHWRMEVKRRRQAAHDNYVAKTYEMEPGDYERLYSAQLGTCAICLRATGKTKRLAVDHDHKTGNVRGLLCGPCNSMLAHARDSDMFFYRAANYLQRPPAKGVLGYE